MTHADPVPVGAQARRCTCGRPAGPDGECAECKQKRQGGRLQRKVSSPHAHSAEAPPIVHEVLRAPGRPLDAATRAFMEPRFGHDFSGVQIHTDARAAESARAVDALAYTVGDNVVFASGQYAPDSSTGQHLLGHELAHVVQQSSSSVGGSLRIAEAADANEHAADRAAEAIARDVTPRIEPGTATPAVARKVVASKVGCTAGTMSAPADPVATLTGADARAAALAGAAAILAQVGSATATMGIPVGNSGVGQSYQNRFGLPPAVRGGFRNRLSGTVAPTQNEAISGELELFGNRLQRIADTFSTDIHYRCINGPTTFMGCSCDCVAKDSCACDGVRATFLCPGFWRLGENGMATLLIHEAAHMNWASVLHAGGYRDASCYANFVADLFNAPLTTPACPTP